MYIWAELRGWISLKNYRCHPVPVLSIQLRPVTSDRVSGSFRGPALDISSSLSVNAAFTIEHGGEEQTRTSKTASTGVSYHAGLQKTSEFV